MCTLQSLCIRPTWNHKDDMATVKLTVTGDFVARDFCEWLLPAWDRLDSDTESGVVVLSIGPWKVNNDETSLPLPQRKLTYFVRGSITVRTADLLFDWLDSTKLVNLYIIQHKQNSWIITSQTGQLYSESSLPTISRNGQNFQQNQIRI